MATIKSYTDLSQSKKLAEILPLESADMCWQKIYDENHLLSDYRIELLPFRLYSGLGVPAWSLAALLDILPILERKGYQKAKPRLLYDVVTNKWIVDSHVYTTDVYDNQIDACVDMIIKLHELKKL